MPRNLVICCDGTNNKFDVANTSVVRIVEVAVQDTTQLVYYDPGVGTLPEPGMWSRFGKKLSEIVDLAFATDIDRRVAIAYEHLMDAWQPGDQVFIFGFSRGAFTARILGGMLHAVGLLPKGNGHLIPYAMRLYEGLTRRNAQKYWAVCDQFRETFARPIVGADDRRFPIHFLGLWDTVSSVGRVWDPRIYAYTFKNPGVHTIRHAISLDERRCFFRQNQVKPADGQDVIERWFPGVHSDIGGGYPESGGGLWRVAFEWMLAHATQAGLTVDPARLKFVRTRSPQAQYPAREPQHESLTGIWWLAEFYPKLVYNSVTKRRRPRLGLGRHRFVADGSMLDRSVVDRLKNCDYRPANLSDAFIDWVKTQAEPADAVAYRAVVQG